MRNLVFGLLLASPSLLFAQNEVDLFRYSAARFQPTARVAGLGGAFGALGADLGAVSLNPAGLSTFRKNTLSLSPQLVSHANEASYLGSSITDNRSRLGFGNLGFAYVKPGKVGSSWKQISYGFTMNRVANFLSETQYEGVNRSSSLVDFFVDEANIGNQFFAEDFPFTAGLAESVGIIYPSIPGNTSSTYFGIVPNGGVRQREIISTSGRNTDYSFTMAGNYNNILHVGGGISLNALTFNSVETFSEFDHMDTIFDFKDFTYERNLLVEGDGLRFRLGSILQPVPWLRLGLSYESGARYNMTEDYRTSLAANFDSVPTFAQARSPLFRPFTYSFRSSNRTTFSAAVLFSGKGLISVDYDIIGFSRMRVDLASVDRGAEPWASGLNNDVQTFLQAGNNLRVGGELVTGPLTWRGGYAYWSTPFRAGVFTGGGDLAQQDASFGVGLRRSTVTFDFSLTHSWWKQYRQPYVVNGIDVDGVLIQNRRWVGMLSMHYRID